MSTIAYNKKQLIERVRRHLADGWPSVEFSITTNEVLLYIDAAIASTLVASMVGIAKLTKEFATPESYIITTQLSSLVKNDVTNEWYATLPQTPLSVSLGYSITNAYFADAANGQSQPIWLIKGKRAAFRGYMPSPGGTRATVRGNVIYIRANDATPLAGLPVYVDMVTTRTSDITAPMNLPDDAIDAVFDKVVVKCMQRLGIPRDVIKDNIGEGSTNINKA